MIREAEYNAFMERLNSPINSKLKSQLSFKSNGYDLAFHIKRINEYVEHWNKTANQCTRQLLELDYAVSLQEAKRLMDEQGWK